MIQKRLCILGVGLNIIKNVSSSDLKELIKWFPELAIAQIRKNVNSSTFLVETLPPDNDWDVKLNDDNRVTAWRSFNHSRNGKMILTSIAGAKNEGSI